ncbi:MAG: DUF4861 family protein [Bacteroidales bacterium]
MFRRALAVLVAVIGLAGTRTALLGSASGGSLHQATATVTVTNPLDLARASETITLGAADLARLLKADDLRRVHVRDPATGRDVLVQAVDVNDDGKFEELIFQTDIGPRARKQFSLAVGERQVLRRDDFKAYGRFVRERRDDFAWENDRIAHRMYGAALETWAQEPLTSSAVDVWTKRVARSVINDWYLLDNYHQDNGDGGDFYSAGKSRGCGGNAVWTGNTLYPSANFRDSRVLANGPIRVMFELVYQPWNAGGVKVSETKRITLDAGANLDTFESRYTVEGDGSQLAHAAGIKKNAGGVSASIGDRGILRTWEPMKNAPGNLGCAVVVDPADVLSFTESDGNYLVVTRLPASRTVRYHAGFEWDVTGQVPGGMAGWDTYLAEFASRLRAPLKVELRPGT